MIAVDEVIVHWLRAARAGMCSVMRSRLLQHVWAQVGRGDRDDVG